MAAKNLKNNILEIVCRVCLKMNKIKFNIFEHQQNNKFVIDMIADCTSIKIQKDDGHPSSICNDCMKKLNIAYDFRMTLLQTNFKLLNFYQQKGTADKTKESESNTVDEIKQENLIESEHSGNVLDETGINDNGDQISLDLSVSRLNTQEHNTNGTGESADLNFYCKNEVPIKEELFDEKFDETKAETDYRSSDDGNAAFDDSDFDTASSDESSVSDNNKEEEKAVKSTSVKKKQNKVRKKRGNINNHNERQAELLDNPDYQRIINSGLSKKEKDRETVYCIECNKTLSFRYYVAIHAYTHTGNVPFKCQQCDKCYPKESLLRKHMRSHFQTRDFACDECGKAFFKKQQLQYHKASKHSEERPHRCSVCDKTFKIPSALWKHSLIHVNDKKYVCEICGKGFVEMVGLNKHKVTHTTEKNFVCTTCGKAFMRKRTLGWHLKKHLDDKPYICSYCGKRFHCTTILKNHILIHTGAKPFACEICGKAFRQRSCIARHMRIHTGETPYPCKLCPSSFKYSHHLLNHMKVHDKELMQEHEINVKTSMDE